MQALEVRNYTLSTCLGSGVAANWRKLAMQHGGLKPCDFETVDLPTYIGEVAGVDAVMMRAGFEKFDCRNNRLTQLALEQDGFIQSVHEAIRQYGADRIGLFIGGSSSGILQTELGYRNRQTDGALPDNFYYEQTHNMHSAGAFVGAFLELTGPMLTVSSACSSSAKVFGNAARMIEAGLIDAAIVGGVDSLCLTTLYGFNSLQLLSAEPARPYAEARDGISIAEGAGFVLLTKPDVQGATDAIFLRGVGESSDAHHMSSPHPQGLGARIAMESALLSAGINASQIGYINLHGTATPSNDAAEGKAVHAVFGAATPCSSTKGATGHTLGAAGIVEAIICMMALQHQVLPAGINTKEIDRQFAIDYLLENRTAPIRYALNNSFGFGGSNCSLVLGVTR